MAAGSFLISLFLLFLFLQPAQAELNPLLERSQKYQNVIVERVLSADRILISGNERIALLGIQGPEAPKRHYVEKDEYGRSIGEENPAVSFEDETLAFVKKLLEGKAVRLEFDVVSRNEDGVLSAYVFLPDGEMANLEIVRQGYATLQLRSPNLRYAEKFRSAYQEARKDMKGLQGEW